MRTLARQGRKLSRGFGLAMLAYDLWRRLPRKRRRKLRSHIRKRVHTLTRQAWGLRRRASRR